MKTRLSIITLLLFIGQLYAQTTLKGVILDGKHPKKEVALMGAQVYWLNTTTASITKQDGTFEIAYTPTHKRLVISFVGYHPDTLLIEKPQEVRHRLHENNTLSEVTVAAKREATERSYYQIENVSTMNSGELLKAACCNLAGSFETNPSIDVNFSDALTGTRQIRMLGLKSPYLLITQENLPMVRGASQIYGMTFIPGSWIESIQITKGAGTVINGFESISGQINTELVKPQRDNRLFLNAYGSMDGKTELNTHLNHVFNEKWSTGLYIHGNYRGYKFDKNDDGFMDKPLENQINVMNRWRYYNGETGWVSSLILRYMKDDKQTGQMDFDPKRHQGSSEYWGSEINTQRFDAIGKIGYVFVDQPYKTFGLQVSYSNHDQNSYFGLRDYDIRQESLYSNFIYNSIIGDTRHKFKTGLTATYDRYNEQVEKTHYDRNESAVGAFFEYGFNNDETFSATAGLRVDHHNVMGTFATPRLHLRYNPWEEGVFRASAGRGQRRANVFAENQQLFASSRRIIFPIGAGINDLEPEVAWNYGLSFLQGFKLFNRAADFSIDFYQTRFENQVIVDWETPQEIAFYNLHGSSIANSLQVDFNIEVFKNFDLRAAYKYTNVSTDYLKGNLQKPLLPEHRFFVNTAYETNKKKNGAQWKFDITFSYKGQQRLPNTNGATPDYSERYGLINAQITKTFSNQFEIYFGGENLTDYKQKNPIIGVDNPFGKDFDSTIIYGPIWGRGLYTGIRFKIK